MTVYKFSFRLIFLLIIYGAILNIAYATKNNTSIAYIAGFVVSGKTNKGVPEAIVIVTQNHKKLFSLRSMQNGWFEAPTSVGEVNDSLDTDKKDKIQLTILKRGYVIYKDVMSIIDFNKKLENNDLIIKLIPIEGSVLTTKEDNYPTKIKYGYVHDTNHKPVKGTVIQVVKETDNEPIPITSAVTRESGYFTLYFQDTDIAENDKIKYTLEHYRYNSQEEYKPLDDKKKLLKMNIEQTKYSYSLGIGINAQTASFKETSDKETGISYSLNLTWYRHKQIVVNGLSPRYNKNGIVGVEVSLGWIPYKDIKPGEDEVGDIFMAGIGLVYARRHSPFLWRLGISRSDTKKNALYFGVNIPFIYF